VAPLSLINAIIVAISMKKKDYLVNSLESLEKIWYEYQVYDTEDEINLNLNYNLNLK